MKIEHTDSKSTVAEIQTHQSETITLKEKTAEQLAHDFSLDQAIPDETNAPGSNDENTENAAEPDAAESLFGLLCLVPIGLNIAGLPKTAKVWNENACRTLASAVIPVCRKYSWGVKFIEFLETGGGVEEIALAAAIAPLALATYAAYNADTYIAPVEKEVKTTADDVKPNAAETFAEKYA